MAQACAKCEREAWKELSTPIDWEDYLREARGDTVFGSLRLPLCRECYPEMDQLKNATMEAGYDDEQRARLNDEIHSALDELELSRVTDTAL